MIRDQWNQLLAQWRANRRLRLFMLGALLIAGTHGLLALDDATTGRMQQHAADEDLLTSLQVAGRGLEWPQRAQDAEKALQVLRESTPAVVGSGMAEAELQAWLSTLARDHKLSDVKIQVEATVDVPGHPGLLQSVARLDGMIPQYGQQAFLKELAGALPWVQVQNLDLSGEGPTRVALIARAFYRQSEAAARERLEIVRRERASSDGKAGEGAR